MLLPALRRSDSLLLLLFFVDVLQIAFPHGSFEVSAARQYFAIGGKHPTIRLLYLSILGRDYSGRLSQVAVIVMWPNSLLSR